MNSVMKKFDECKAWNLPVVNDGEYIGFISKSSFLSKYREQIKPIINKDSYRCAKYKEFINGQNKMDYYFSKL